MNLAGRRTPIRIAVSSGLMVAAATVVAASAVPAQVSVKAGSRVRIMSPAFGAEPVITSLVRLEGDTLVVQTHRRLPELALGPEDVGRLEVSAGRTNRRSSYLSYGIGTGFGAGAVLGLAVGSYLVNADLSHSTNEVGRALVGGLIGAGAGAVVGIVLGSASHQDVWTIVDHRALRVALGPGPSGSGGLGLRLTLARR